MAYANVTDLDARAGAVLSSSDPGLQDHLDAVAAEIDGVLATNGYAVPLENPVAHGALLGVNIDGALVLALEAKYPNGGPGVQVLLEGARKRYERAWAQLEDGTHPALGTLSEDGSGAAVLEGSSFQVEEPNYTPDPLRPWLGPLPNPYMTPEIHSGMTF